MGQAIPVRTNYTAGEVRRFAQRAKDAAQARRLLAIAAIARDLSDTVFDYIFPRFRRELSSANSPRTARRPRLLRVDVLSDAGGSPRNHGPQAAAALPSGQTSHVHCPLMFVCFRYSPPPKQGVIELFRIGLADAGHITGTVRALRRAIREQVDISLVHSACQCCSLRQHCCFNCGPDKTGVGLSPTSAILYSPSGEG
jgi:hypothetical protein